MATFGELLVRTTAMRFAAPVALGAAALALSGCGGSSTGASSPVSSPASVPAGRTASAAPGTHHSPAEMRPVVPLEDAGATAVRQVPGGTLVSIELEEHGAVWETQVVAADGTEHAIDVRTSGGAVDASHVKHESAAKRAEHQKRVRTAKLGYADAAGKARAAVPGGKVTELNLDDFRGTTVWESDVTAANTKHEVTIDATTGATIANRTSSPD